jgi:hypothetical protein
MIARMRWRLGLAFLGLALALAAAVVSQSQTPMRLPGTHYRGALVYSEDGTLVGPKAQVASYCLDMPAFSVANIVHSRLVSYDETFHDQNWFPLFGYAEYYISVLVFWWCIGWCVDRRAVLRSTRPSALDVIAAAAALLLSIDLLHDGIALLLRRQAPTGPMPRGSAPIVYSMPTSSVLWGLALAATFLWYLYKFVRQGSPKHQPARQSPE